MRLFDRADALGISVDNSQEVLTKRAARDGEALTVKESALHHALGNKRRATSGIKIRRNKSSARFQIGKNRHP